MLKELRATHAISQKLKELFEERGHAVLFGTTKIP